MSDNETPFSRYRDGYVDGYEGNVSRTDQDDDYVRGYHDGSEDDRIGAPSKYDESTPIAPISPSMASFRVNGDGE